MEQKELLNIVAQFDVKGNVRSEERFSRNAETDL